MDPTGSKDKYIFDLSFDEKYQYSSIGTHIRKRGEGRKKLINADSGKYFNKKNYQNKLLHGKSTRDPRTHEEQHKNESTTSE